jgi:two-component system, NtrC family, response regulator GlrR
MQFDPAAKLIGQAPRFRQILGQVTAIARTDAPVLIEGETGTGKELIARAMHYFGPRSDNPFIPANCGALPENLIENEFFGHARGAYTDAREPQQGLIAQAQGGTLFLDEIDALPLRGQVALLRFLQDLRYRPLGATRDEFADVRIIAATNADLEQVVAQKQFRADLFYRLKILSLTLPALRERPGDAELLAHHFVRLYGKQYKTCGQRIAGVDLAWMRGYSWPGNVRELENVVHRAVVHSHGRSTIDLGAMFCDTSRQCAPALSAADRLPLLKLGFQRAKAAAVQEFERSFVECALLECGGNVSAAARLSGKERRAFGKLMKKHGLSKPTLPDRP